MIVHLPRHCVIELTGGRQLRPVVNGYFQFAATMLESGALVLHSGQFTSGTGAGIKAIIPHGGWTLIHDGDTLPRADGA